MRFSIIIISTIRAAFEKIKVLSSAYTEEGAIMGAQISDALNSKVGMASVPSWNANLSFKTAQSLDAPMFNPVKIVNKGTPDQKSVSVFRERAYTTCTFNKMCGA